MYDVKLNLLLYLNVLILLDPITEVMSTCPCNDKRCETHRLMKVNCGLPPEKLH